MRNKSNSYLGRPVYTEASQVPDNLQARTRTVAPLVNELEVIFLPEFGGWVMGLFDSPVAAIPAAWMIVPADISKQIVPAGVTKTGVQTGLLIFEGSSAEQEPNHG